MKSAQTTELSSAYSIRHVHHSPWGEFDSCQNALALVASSLRSHGRDVGHTVGMYICFGELPS